MIRYRYRTPALHGPWRTTPDEAARDAIRARQALADAEAPYGVRFRLPGTIEERDARA